MGSVLSAGALDLLGGTSLCRLANLAIIVVLLTALAFYSNIALGAPCAGQNTSAVLCNGVTTASDAERITTNSFATAVTIAGANNDFGLAAVQSGVTPTSLTVTNDGSVIVDSPIASSSSRPVLQLIGNGGLVTYSGSGSISDNTFSPSSPGLVITNTANGGGGINANVGGVINAIGGINLTTAGSGSINLTATSQTTSVLGDGISTTSVNGQTSVTLTGSIQAGGFGISAASSGNGGITVDTSGGLVNSGLTGVSVGTTGWGNLFVNAGIISSSLENGIFASTSGPGTGNIRVDANGAISAAQEGISAGGPSAVTVNINNDIAAGGRGVDAAGGNGLTLVNQTAGTITAGGDGIDAGSIGRGGVSINMSGGEISAGGVGIFSQSLGSAGGISIVANTISAVSDGVYARVGDGQNEGNISILVNTGASIGSASGAAIFAQSVGSGNIAIVNNGSARASDAYGIDAEITKDPFSQTGSGSISLTNNANLTSGGSFAGVNFVGGLANTLINTGSIAGNVGVQLSGGMTTLVNNGAITGNGGTALLVSSGTLAVLPASGTIFGTTVVNNTATLTGTGAVANTQVNSGGTFAPGNGMPGSSMTIAGSLALQSGALYEIYFNPTASSFSIVSGAASLAGTVNAVFAPGSYVTKQYKILQSAGLNGSMFSGLSNTNLPVGFTDSLSYSADDVFLYLTAALGAGTPLTGNEEGVANAINNFFNSGGPLPPSFVNLFNLFGANLANALTQIDGENATGAERGAFDLMTEFLSLMLGSYVDGRFGGGAGGPLGFAPDQAGSLPPEIALAYAGVLKAPAKPNFAERWTAWGGGFGSRSTANGDPGVGSNNVTTGTFGYAAGMDYHVSPGTVVGSALAGGGTSWNLAQELGTGRSDAFLAGVYSITRQGPVYLSGALAFANNWFTTARTALGDQLTANFQGQSYAARVEGGYRFILPVAYNVVGVAPYAAVQAQDFHTAVYSETNPITGGGFGLSYAAMNATDTRSELGGRFDDLTTLYVMPLMLRARVAWAHDWASNPSLNATFESLPGSASFTVFGAPIPPDSALASASAQLFFTPNWSLLAKFDGEFASCSKTYAGSGTLRYTW